MNIHPLGYRTLGLITILFCHVEKGKERNRVLCCLLFLYDPEAQCLSRAHSTKHPWMP